MHLQFVAFLTSYLGTKITLKNGAEKVVGSSSSVQQYFTLTREQVISLHSYLLVLKKQCFINHYGLRLNPVLSLTACFEAVIPNRWYAKVYQVVRELIIFFEG